MHAARGVEDARASCPLTSSVCWVVCHFPPGNRFSWRAPGTSGRKGSRQHQHGTVLAVALWLLRGLCSWRGRAAAPTVAVRTGPWAASPGCGASLDAVAACGAQRPGASSVRCFLVDVRLGFKSPICFVPTVLVELSAPVCQCLKRVDPGPPDRWRMVLPVVVTLLT